MVRRSCRAGARFALAGTGPLVRCRAGVPGCSKGRVGACGRCCRVPRARTRPVVTDR